MDRRQEMEWTIFFQSCYTLHFYGEIIENNHLRMMPIAYKSKCGVDNFKNMPRLFQRLYNVHNVRTTSYERWNDVVCVHGWDT